MRNEKIYSVDDLPLAELKTIENDEVYQYGRKAARVKKARVYLFGTPDGMTPREGRSMVAEILAVHGAEMGIPAGSKVTFSAKAGCSPGFVIDHATNFEIFATVTA